MWHIRFWRKPLLDQPTERDLRRWACSQWVEYQAWLFHHSFITLRDWQQLRQDALSWPYRPLISIVTPVFNTLPAYLQECIYSVQTQAYPHWEMCLVDDGSDNQVTLTCLEAIAADPRLHLKRLPYNQGICHATNQALAMAKGDYIAFLDHDDRLAPDALYHMAKTIRDFPNTDIVYSDRDMLSPEGFRFMHLFKPSWSPESLLSGNYIFHLMMYKRQLLEQLQGVRVGLEGSQDYDLILRAADTEPQVQHVPKVLYHWRQHEHSVAKEHNAKEYAYSAGMRALRETLERRGLKGEVSENLALWRGNYRVCLQPLPSASYRVLSLEHEEHYAQQINHAFSSDPKVDYLIILGSHVQPLDKDTLTELVSWLQITQVGMVTGKVLNKEQRLLHTGLVMRPTGIPLAIYTNSQENEAGYMAVTASVRNLSTPHPACCALKRTLWHSLAGLNTHYRGPHALLDFALRALQINRRIVYTPFARFLASDWHTPETWPSSDCQRFVEQWATWLKQGDPYYHPYLTLELTDMGLNTHWLCEQ